MSKTFIIFLLVGALQYLLDAGAFSLLILNFSTDVANVISRFFGASAGYYLNGYFTFAAVSHKNVFDIRKIGKFLLLWCGLTLLSTFFIKTTMSLIGSDDWGYIVATKLAVEALLVIISFTLQKYFVYR